MDLLLVAFDRARSVGAPALCEERKGSTAIIFALRPRTPSYGASLYVDEAGWQQRFTIGEPSEEDVAAILRAISGAGEIPVRWSVLTCQHR